MLHWMAHVIDVGGSWGVAALMAIENVVLPLPSEIIMPLAGYVSDRGRMTLWGAIVFGAAGSALGALGLYYPARILGEKKVTAWLDRHGRWLLRRGDLARAQRQFSKRGAVAVFFSQLVPGLRGLISLPAGFAHMNVVAFVLWNFAGTLVWCVVLAFAGKMLGAQFMKVDNLLGRTGWIILGVLLAGTMAWLVRRRQRG
jgi:membrane protein DedA with SNARE-associated domain